MYKPWSIILEVEEGKEHCNYFVMIHGISIKKIFLIFKSFLLLFVLLNDRHTHTDRINILFKKKRNTFITARTISYIDYNDMKKEYGT